MSAQTRQVREPRRDTARQTPKLRTPKLLTSGWAEPPSTSRTRRRRRLQLWAKMGKYGDDGSPTQGALCMAVSETLAAALDGHAGAPLRINEDDTLSSAMALGRRLGKVPGPDGVHCETLQLVCGRTVARKTAVLNQGCVDLSAGPLPACWAQRRLAVIPKLSHRRTIPDLRPLGLVPTFQK